MLLLFAANGEKVYGVTGPKKPYIHTEMSWDSAEQKHGLNPPSPL